MLAVSHGHRGSPDSMGFIFYSKCDSLKHRVADVRKPAGMGRNHVRLLATPRRVGGLLAGHPKLVSRIFLLAS
jgi:hypothetical protein